MPFLCPFCRHEPFDQFNALRSHARVNHSAGACPICGRLLFNVQLHAAKLARLRDIPHKVCYGLISSSSVSDRQLRNKCEAVAMRSCRVPPTTPTTPPPSRSTLPEVP